jgi:hypothetical protein
MARPRRNPTEPSTETLSFRVTKTEMQALDTQAERRGVTRVEAARIALNLLSQPPPPSKPPVTHAVIETVPATRPRKHPPVDLQPTFQPAARHIHKPKDVGVVKYRSGAGWVDRMCTECGADLEPRRA